jgi:hypothetical protein
MTEANSSLSHAEVNALRRVANGLANFLPSVHRERLSSIGLVAVNGAGHLVLTQLGNLRLAKEDAVHASAINASGWLKVAEDGKQRHRSGDVNGSSR